MAVADYNETASLNVTIGGINIGEGCPPANINNAFRQYMADIKTFSLTVPDVADLIPKEGGVFAGVQPIYSGRGSYTHWNDPALTSGRMFIVPNGASDPSGLVAGDILYDLA